jgi:starch phosphorylase
VLGVGGMRVLEAMGISPGVVHMNEGHSAFAVLELARTLMERDGQMFVNVREKTAAMCVFTTHTPVPAGHDRFGIELVQDALTPLREELGISEHDLMALGREDPNNHGELFCMTVLGLKMSRHRNAVSALHGRVSREMWRGLWPDLPVHELPIDYITNGVHAGTWMASEMDRLYRRCMGGRLAGSEHPDMWMSVNKIDDEEFWEQDQILKQHLIDFVKRRVKRQSEARGESDPMADGKRTLESGILTIGFARRFAQYKRGTLLFRDLDRLDRLVNDKQHPVQFVFAGKAHPADNAGKEIIKKIFEVTRDKRFAGRVVFIEDYDINVGRHLYQGVDVWMNLPRRPLEACGTSGQKAVLNGALNLSILDGWWAEGYDGTNGFAVGNGAEHSNWETQDESDFESLFGVLEQKVVPCYYDREAETGIPRRWIGMQKSALRTLAWRFSAHRMVREYTLACYLPAVGGLTTSFPVEGTYRRF